MSETRPIDRRRFIGLLGLTGTFGFLGVTQGPQGPPGPPGGAPTDADYLIGTANGTLSNEIVVGPTPGGELGGSWFSPTVDAVHAGSAHHAEAHALTSHTTKAHSELTGVGVDDHHAQNHKARHVVGGADAFVAADDLVGVSRGLRETGGPTLLTMGSVADGQVFQRSGTNIVGLLIGSREFAPMFKAQRTYTNLGAGPVESNAADRIVVDLTNFVDVRLLAAVMVAGVSGKLKAQYSTNNGSTWSDLTTLLNLAPTGTKASAVQNIPAGAKTLILVRIVAVQGNGTEDPQVNAAVLEASYGY